MSKFQVWVYLVSAILIALLANSVSAIWAQKPDKFSLWLVAMLLLSPLVFITFGLVTSKFGLTIGSATIDTLLALCTILVGIFIFGEGSSISMYQYIGLVLAFVGVILMHIKRI